jgi:hypothetical protein
MPGNAEVRTSLNVIPKFVLERTRLADLPGSLRLSPFLLGNFAASGNIETR